MSTSREAKYEALTREALRLSTRAVQRLGYREATEVARLAWDCRKAKGDDRIVLGMTLTRYSWSALVARGKQCEALCDQFAALDVAWETTSTRRRRAA